MKISLSRVQFFLLLFITQTGSSFFSFPSPFIAATGRDAWLIFIVAGTIHYLLLLLYEKNYNYFSIGPYIGWLYKGYWLFICVCYLAYVDYTLAVWGFPETPPSIVIAVLVSVSLYANLSRAETVINLSVILIPLILLFMIFLQFAWKEFVWTNIFPIGEATGKQWGIGLLKAQIAFIGMELYLFFRKYIDMTQKIKGFPLFVYQSVWLLFFLISIFISLFYYTLTGLKMIPEPLLYLLKSQEVTFVERLDLFFLYIWTIWTIITVTIISFVALYVHRLHAKENRKRDTIIWHLLLIVIPLFFLTKGSVEKLNDVIIYVHLTFAFIIPIIVITVNRRKVK
ncbi:spore germination protein [Sporosarcina sp. ACRSM]|uniref:GerAB/ArcD/ProY family transporter n=1 Tax=Sporosarcina sp. ACRSM TaxID=2918216 RepID=UPI001EF5480D|nr:GerAB/ArcD/ProY family transporter [Sporosarcina sp. ACRSM]MCG7334505.1 spore germination protein [Sporosarcina sp. ACRSM]